jgi:ubiquitin carboxyl-terminal hydrolase 10
MLIEQLPPILIIHLKCFLYDEADGTKKLNKTINYSVNLTLPKGKQKRDERTRSYRSVSFVGILTESARKQYDRYKLFAVEQHQGDQPSRGHYITDVFHPGLQGWLRYDDSTVQVVTSSQVINSSMDKLTPYLLFYRRGD